MANFAVLEDIRAPEFINVALINSIRLKKEAALLHSLGAAIPNFPKFVHTEIVL